MAGLAPSLDDRVAPGPASIAEQEHQVVATKSFADKVYGRLRYGFGAGGKARRRAAKRSAREALFESGSRWQRTTDSGLAQRRYGTYEDYLEHQAEKLDLIHARREVKDQGELEEFLRRFRTCPELAGKRNALCLGARLGTEVKALQQLGLFALGIDLNPGPANPYVAYGDFHHLAFADNSVDVVYTNALDHVFDLERVIAEVSRVLAPAGVFVLDLLPGYEEGFTPGEYESTHWPTKAVLLDKVAAAGGFAVHGVRDLGQRRRDRWFQAVFSTKSAGPVREEPGKSASTTGSTA